MPINIVSTVVDVGVDWKGATAQQSAEVMLVVVCSTEDLDQLKNSTRVVQIQDQIRCFMIQVSF